MVYEFISTSKISFAGGGIAAVAASEANRKEILDFMRIQTICHDKLNQLRHGTVFKEEGSITEHMKKGMRLYCVLSLRQ